MRPRSLFICIVCSLVSASGIRAQVHLPEDRGAGGLWQALLKLRTTASAMHIVAHPDDEDAGTITRLARGEGAHVTMLSLTRGEGGANLISPHFFDELGVLRTLEYLEADRHYGVEQFFTRAADLQGRDAAHIAAFLEPAFQEPAPNRAAPPVNRQPPPLLARVPVRET